MFTFETMTMEEVFIVTYGMVFLISFLIAPFLYWTLEKDEDCGLCEDEEEGVSDE